MSPLWVLAVPFVTAPLVYLARRASRLAGPISAAISLGLALSALILPWATRAELMGWTFVFDTPRQAVYIVLQLGMAGLFLYGWRISQGWSFFPFALMASALLGIALTSQRLLLSILALELAGLLLVFLIQSGARERTRGALSFLVPWFLAGPPLVYIARTLDQAALPPETAPARFIAAGLAVGFGLWLGTVPFQGFPLSALEDSPPMVSALLLGPYRIIIAALLVLALAQHPWLAADPRIAFLLQGAGGLSILVGGVLALLQSSPAVLLAYAALADLGVVLLAVGTGRVDIALYQLALHLGAVVLLTMSWGALRYYGALNGHHGVAAVANRTPWAKWGYLLGGLALAGVPLSGGFISRWALARSLAGTSPLWGALLVGAAAAVGLSYLRQLNGGGEAVVDPPAERWVPGLVLALMVLNVGLGLVPVPLLDLARTWAQGLGFSG
ncbi:MAG: hypothetical protein HYZ68_04775 [Chloroflexi bacterium]|nr:hypothetical protein [Chloroflexota bacterium]